MGHLLPEHGVLSIVDYDTDINIGRLLGLLRLHVIPDGDLKQYET